MYSEIKYDGERVQVHKNGDHFSYFSRSLKPVLPHKVRRYSKFYSNPFNSNQLTYIGVRSFLLLSQVAHFKEFIPQAFAGGHSMILDAEVLLIDTRTSKPLPFGTLGVHKVSKLHRFLFYWKGFQLAISMTFCFCFRKQRSKMHRCACLFLTAFILMASASWTSECFID